MEQDRGSKPEQPLSTEKSNTPRKRFPEAVTHLPNLAKSAVEARKIQDLQRLIKEMGKTPEIRQGVTEVMGKVAGEVVYRSEQVSEFMEAGYQSRQEIENDPQNRRGLGYHTVKTVLEMIPFGLGPYGIGDAITLVEAIRGKEIYGRRLDTRDRVISLIAAILPVVPATPFREGIRKLRRHVEDSTVKKRQSQKSA